MPIAWRILPAERMVVARADGPVTLQDIMDYLDAVIVGDAQPYAKLFDTGTMQLKLTDSEMMELAARMSAYSGAFAEAGPLAFVASTLVTESFAKRFLNVSSVRRPAKLFRSVEQAKAWLETLTK